MNFSHRVFFNNCSFDLWALNKTTYQIVKLLSKGAMLKKTKVEEKVLVGVHQNSEKETFSSFGLTPFSILFSVFREVEPCGTTLNSMKNHPGSQTTKKVRKYICIFRISRWELKQFQLWDGQVSYHGCGIYNHAYKQVVKSFAVP